MSERGYRTRKDVSEPVSNDKRGELKKLYGCIRIIFKGHRDGWSCFYKCSYPIREADYQATVHPSLNTPEVYRRIYSSSQSKTAEQLIVQAEVRRREGRVL